MARHTGNQEVVENLQNALGAFLADHRKAASEDPEWIADWTEDSKNMTPEERENFPGCGCDDCIAAGQLLGRI